MKFSKLTLLFAIFIILSAAVMRQVLNFLYQNLGAKRLELVIGFIFILSGIIFFRRVGFSFNLKTASNLFLLGVGLLAFWQLKIIEERVHLLEYGLLGWLVTRDILFSVKRGNILKSIVLPLLFVSFIGILDELFQWWLPTRVGDIRDVVFNTLGGTWGIALKILNNTSENVVT